MDQLRRPEPVSHELTAVSFGFFTSEEARRVSVKRITATEMLDKLDNAVPDGLYDPAMGPTDPKGTCATCKQGYAFCPGHFGHIQLPVPVYNPLVFNTVLRLLRASCLACGCFRMGERRAAAYARRLRLLARGRLADALSVSVAPRKEKKRGGLAEEADEVEDEEEEEEEEAQAGEEEEEAAAAGNEPLPGAAAAPAWTTHAWGEARALIASFLASQPGASKCERCGARSPPLSAEAPSKILRKPLGAKHAAANAALGVDVEEQLLQLWARVTAKPDERDVASLFGDAPPVTYERQPAARDSDDEAQDEEDAEDVEEEEEEEEAMPLLEPRGARRPAAPAARRGAAATAAAAAAAEADAPAPRVILVTPTEARALLRRLWEREGDWVSLAYAADAAALAGAVAAAPPPLGSLGGPSAHKRDPGCLFFQTLLVTPNRLRPPSRMEAMTIEHPQNEHYRSILLAATRLADVMAGTASHAANAAAAAAAAAAGGETTGRSAAAAAKSAAYAARLAEELSTARGRAERGARLWQEIQAGVNRLLGVQAAGSREAQVGIRQQLEKKSGLFRMNMMGKRVNYAARSVISPDPFLAPSEIGVPPFVAMRLTFTEMVTAHNVAALRRAVQNGPDVYPGAVAVESEGGKVVQLAHLSAQKREALAKTLLTAGAPRAGGSAGGAAAWGAKAVYRHLVDGDVMLTNRQPTLHKPGIMAHTARVLRGQRTIRMHYANCATFNADFDGDEINLHLPQEQCGRAEAYGIVAADEQFCVPTDGKPIRGLIQDHVVAGCLLLKRGTFLTRSQAAHLLYQASLALPGGAPAGGGLKHTRPPHEVLVLPGGLRLSLPTPALIKPLQLWSGKQVLGCLLDLLAAGRPGVTVSQAGRVPADYWGRDGAGPLGEATLEVRGGYVVRGVLDKAAFTKFGLVHAVAELYGNADSGRLLAALSRLLTAFLADHGFTCGLDDMRLSEEAERARVASLAGADAVSAAAAEEFAFAGAPPRPAGAPPRSAAEVTAVLVSRLRERAGAEAGLDAKSTGPLSRITSATIKGALPHGQVKPFPRNCLSLMTVSGAKGGSVNFAQISALLGQQELEGRRVPRMASGKTLPCFSPWDTAARAGGYIADRFLGGIRPQEYYFHCMAGREGLVDTAVKTSRSGYLQRCLVKNLEALSVAYDGTVRDGSDGGIVQFCYGEDGLDVTRTGYARRFDFLAQNAAAVAAGMAAWAPLRSAPPLPADPPGAFGPPGLPLLARLPASRVGVVGEAFRDALGAYVASNPEGLLGEESESEEDLDGRPPRPSAASFVRLCELRHLRAAAAPGEAVGVIAAQSVGEPSTQMTLNTFHFAGRGEANVTLGIPRLRELLMAAARKIGTPVMTLPVAAGGADGGEAAARRLAASLRRVTLAELLDDFSVTERPFDFSHPAGCARGYTLRAVLRCEADPAAVAAGSVGFEEASSAFRTEFARALYALLKAELRRASSDEAAAIASAAAGARRAPAVAAAAGEGEEAAEAEAEAEEEAPAAGAARRRCAEAEVGEEAGVDEEEEEEEEEGAKADDRRAARAGEGYTLPQAEDAGKPRRRAAAAAAAAAAADAGAAGGSEQSASEAEESEAESEEEKKPAARKGGATSAAGGLLLTTLEALQAGVTADEAARTVSCTLHLRLDAPKVLMLALAQRAASRAAVRATKGIAKCYVLPPAPEQGQGWRVQTDGINFPAAFSAPDDSVLAARIASNDVFAILQQYGVEAARATLLAEVRAVFGAYGIGVDPRHLSLIADAMMHTGSYRPCSRAGIDACPSPLLKMSFETATTFLTDATLRGSSDALHSPSARLVLGRLVELGTGAFALSFDFKRAQRMNAEKELG